MEQGCPITECPLTKDDITAIKTASYLLLRIRNAAGNTILVLLGVVLLMAVGGLLYLITGGHVNLFKLFGIGS